MPDSREIRQLLEVYDPERVEAARRTLAEWLGQWMDSRRKDGHSIEESARILGLSYSGLRGRLSPGQPTFASLARLTEATHRVLKYEKSGKIPRPLSPNSE